jgi:hypothetical protein
MSSLEVLSLDVDGENQQQNEDLLILGLPKLKYFNGLSLMGDEGDDDAFFDESYANQLTDIADPPSAPVSTYPALPSPSQIASAAALPVDTDENLNSSTNQALEEADLESAALLFGAVKELMGKLDKADDEKLR